MDDGTSPVAVQRLAEVRGGSRRFSSLVPGNAERATAAHLQRQFPGTVIWYGTRTLRWWAMVRWAGTDRFVEAAHPAELHHRLTAARHNSRPPRPPDAHTSGWGPDGSWAGAPARSTPRTPKVSRTGVPAATSPDAPGPSPAQRLTAWAISHLMPLPSPAPRSQRA